MGTNPRVSPKRLAEKLLHVRTALGLSPDELIRRLGAAEALTPDDIAAYERGAAEPSLLTLLLYARASGLTMEVLADDESELPGARPARARREPPAEPTDTADTTGRLNRAFRRAVESDPHRPKQRATKKRP